MLNTQLNLTPSDSFKNCRAFVRIASVPSDSKDTTSSWPSVYVAGSAGLSGSPRAVTTFNTTLIPARSNNTTPTLYAPTAASVRIKKYTRYEKRNVDQLVAVLSLIHI